MLNKTTSAVLLVAAASMSPMSGHAVMAACVYTVSSVSMPPDGTLHATLIVNGGSAGLQYVSLCNLSTTVDNVSPAACKGIHNTLLMAKAMSRPVQMWFDSPTAFTCSGLSWTALRPLGWYWGPELL